LAWSSCPFKKELIELIKNSPYLETVPALTLLTEITGIETNPSRTVEDVLAGLSAEDKELVKQALK
jgi:hypothetical protein